MKTLRHDKFIKYLNKIIKYMLIGDSNWSIQKSIYPWIDIYGSNISMLKNRYTLGIWCVGLTN